jgi:hypothetical protein
MTALDDLREAARLLRDRAQAATPGPWEHTEHGQGGSFMGCGQVITWGDGVEGGNIAAPSGDLYPRGGYSPSEDMAYIATVHPGVGLALARLLDEHADSVEQDGGQVITSDVDEAVKLILGRVDG